LKRKEYDAINDDEERNVKITSKEDFTENPKLTSQTKEEKIRTL
jgi:hypothetical protein